MSDTADDLPIGSRDALARMLMDALADQRKDAAIEDALARARAFGEMRAIADRLDAYREVLGVVPRGKGLGARLSQAQAMFAVGLFFEVHEVLEPAWLSARDRERRWLQGLIQAAVAWYHWQRGNVAGARSLAGSAAEKLEDAPTAWLGFPVATVHRAASLWSSWLDSGATGRRPALPFERVER
jgi:hypothetical protein